MCQQLLWYLIYIAPLILIKRSKWSPKKYKIYSWTHFTITSWASVMADFQLFALIVWSSRTLHSENNLYIYIPGNCSAEIQSSKCSLIAVEQCTASENRDSKIHTNIYIYIYTYITFWNFLLYTHLKPWPVLIVFTE